mmetsp:Transcript_28100/g.61533  ORF Transcript_28100/g.61533 Transcript_28100/m.61533 type:complete len:221 (+) Transcript_28100:101-763(+)
MSLALYFYYFRIARNPLKRLVEQVEGMWVDAAPPSSGAPRSQIQEPPVPRPMSPALAKNQDRLTRGCATSAPSRFEGVARTSNTVTDADAASLASAESIEDASSRPGLRRTETFPARLITNTQKRTAAEDAEWATLELTVPSRTRSLEASIHEGRPSATGPARASSFGQSLTACAAACAGFTQKGSTRNSESIPTVKKASSRSSYSGRSFFTADSYGRVT